LKAGQYLAVPIPRSEGNPVDSKYARLLGYYIGDGSVSAPNGEKHSTVQFTLNLNDAGRHEIPQLAQWTTSECLHNLTNQAVVLTCSSTEVAERLKKDCGQAERKSVPALIFNADYGAQMEFLCGWFNSDGWQDKNGLHWSTCDRRRALDLQLLLAVTGLASSCVRIDHPEDRGIVKGGSGIEYVVNVSNKHSKLFANRSKASVQELKQGSKLGTFISGSYLLVMIDEIEYVEEPTTVYNLSVEKDESYTASLLAVHNCKVAYDICSYCGNRARTRREYCDHLLNSMTDMTKSGHAVFAINDEPNFFDISKVARPADRIAWSLRKVAAYELAPIGGAALAEEFGLTEPSAALTKSSLAASRQKLAAVEKLSAIEKKVDSVARGEDNPHLKSLLGGLPEGDLPDGEMKKLKGAKLPSALSGLADAKICLSVKDFMRLVMGSSMDEDTISDLLPSVKGRLPGIFSRAKDSGESDELASDGAYDAEPTAIPRQIKEMLGSVMGDHSMAEEPVLRRIRIMIIRGGPKHKLETSSEKSAAVSPQAEQIAREYAKYQLAFVSGADQSLTNELTVLRNFARV
jgi:hypothetical protein